MNDLEIQEIGELIQFFEGICDTICRTRANLNPRKESIDRFLDALSNLYDKNNSSVTKYLRNGDFDLFRKTTKQFCSDCSQNDIIKCRNFFINISMRKIV